MQIIKIYNRGLNQSPDTYNANASELASPISIRYTLDESLDSGSLSLLYITRREPFAPFTFLSAQEGAGGSPLFWLVASDSVTEYPAIGRYTHQISIIETTKYLERLMLGTKTVTQPIGRAEIYTHAQPIYGENNTIPEIASGDDYGNPHTISSATNNFVVKSFDDVLGHANVQQYIQTETTPQPYIAVHIGSRTGTIVADWNLSKSDADMAATHTVTVGTDLVLVVEYYWMYMADDQQIYYEITTIRPEDKPPVVGNPKTIADVIQMICACAEPIRINDVPRLFYSDTGYNYDNIIAPEYTFTSATVWEALSIVGQTVHAIPRLFVRTSPSVLMRIEWDTLGVSDYADLSELRPAVNGEKLTISSEQYCSTVTSNVQNAVSRSKSEGTIAEPSDTALKTLRAEEGEYRITEASSHIDTSYPIESIEQLIIKYLDATDPQEIDITPYVYEQAAYAALSSYERLYPHSKQYALYYVQGQRGIRGLQFEPQNALSQIFEEPAITAIYEKETGEQIQTLFTEPNMSRFLFRVVYTPVVNVEARQVKDSVEDNAETLILAYNQGANKIDTDNYGKNLAGTVSRLGTAERQLLYVTSRGYALSSARLLVGKLYDDDYAISAVTTEIFTPYAKVQIELSKNYNRINQYVGVSAELRQYDVSERQSYDRYIVYEDYIVLGTGTARPDDALVTNYFMDALMNMFSLGTIPADTIEYAVLEGTDEAGTKRQKVALPVISLGIGRSMLFALSYLDSYGAGYSAYLNKGTYRIQQNVNYGDPLGELASLSVRMSTRKNSASLLNATSDSADLLPAVGNSTIPSVFVSTSRNGDNDLLILKDGRERINLSYQIHFVSDSGYIISSAIGSMMPFVNRSAVKRLYFAELTRKINRFADNVGTAVKRTVSSLYSPARYGNEITLAPRDEKSFLTSGKAWAVCDIDGNILFGKNESFSVSGSLPVINITATHKISI